jgi:MHS family alpha-ketoglutarate permease-like MFS transporter
VFGRRRLPICFGLRCTLFSAPLVTVLSYTKDPFVAFMLSLAALDIQSGFTSVHMLAKTEMFPARIRTRAVG